MADFSYFHCWSEDLAHGVHNLDGTVHTFKVLLTNTLPDVSADTVLADIVPIAEENGYSVATVTVDSSGQTGGNYKWVIHDISWTASGGSFGPYAFAVLYNDTPVSPNKPLIGFWDLGSSSATADGDTLKLDADPVTGTLQLNIPV